MHCESLSFRAAATRASLLAALPTAPLLRAAGGEAALAKACCGHWARAAAGESWRRPLGKGTLLRSVRLTYELGEVDL